jgi:hypothetical protein
MANSQNPNPPTFRPSKTKSGTFVPNSEKKGKGANQENADKVEIGDPVPEEDRTTRAAERGDRTRGSQTRGQGETGEDEDLPDDGGGIEGTRGDRH